MKKTILTATITLALIYFSFSPSAFTESNAEKYLGEKKSCLQIGSSFSSYVLDDQTMLFETDHGVVYINRLPSPCFGLKVSDGYSYSTTIHKLCKQDIIRLLENSYGLTNSCGLGEFIEMNGTKNIRDASRILKEGGILESLIKEGAFNNKEASP